MKVKLVIIIILTYLCLATVQGQNLFNKNYQNTDGSGNWIVFNLIVKDNLYILNGGYSVLREDCNSYWSRGTFLISIDSIGSIINNKHYSYCNKSIYEGSGNSIISCSSEDRFYSCGVVFYNDTAVSSDYLTCLNQNLDTLNFFEYNSDTTTKRVFSLCNSNDSCFVLAGSVDSSYNELLGSPETTFSKSYLCKLSSEGETIWSKSYSFGDISDGCWSTFHNVISTYDNGYIVTGRTSDFGNSKNIILKTDSLGNQQWVRFYGNGAYDNPAFTDIIATHDSCYIVCGAFTHGETGGGYYPYDAWMIKIDNNGTPKWDKTYRDSIYDAVSANDYYGYYMGVAEKSNGDLITVCRTKSDANMNYIGSRFRIRCLDSFGNRKWDKIIDSLGNQVGIFNPQSIVLTDDNGIAVGGWAEIYYFNELEQWVSDQRIFLIKTDSLGNDTVLSNISPYQANPITKFDLVCYPNPASSEFFVDLPQGIEDDVLEIYSTSGALVHEQAVGKYNNRVDICNLKQGMYLVRLRGKGLFGKIIVE